MNFPSSPSVNQTYSLGTKTWKWNGVAWDLQSVGLTSGNIVTALGYTPYNAASLSTDLSPYLLSATAASTYTTKTNPTTTGTLKNTGGRSYFGPNGEVYAVGVGYNATRVNAGQVFYIGGTDSANPDLVFSEAAGSERLRLTSLGSFGLGTSSPSKKFVVSNAGANGLEFQPDDAVTYGYNRLLSYNRSTLAYTPLVMQASEFRLWTGQIAERFVLDGSGNLGLGVTPSAWGTASSRRAIELPGGGNIWGQNFGGSNPSMQVYCNAYESSTGPKYTYSTYASGYQQNAGTHAWFTAASGTAGNAISFTTAMTLDASSNLTATGNVTAYSDERLKTDWSSLPADFIERLAGVKNGTYTRIDNGQRQIGVGAQSLQPVAPDGVLEGEHLSVAYGNVALAAAVELAKRVVRLEAQINAMIGD